jgi:hypothetical protein
LLHVLRALAVVAPVLRHPSTACLVLTAFAQVVRRLSAAALMSMLVVLMVGELEAQQ